MIPTSPAECSDDTVGGLPALECEGIDPETYQVTLNGSWNPAGLPPEFLPALQIGSVSPGDYDPAPPGTGVLTTVVSYAPVLQPIVGAPTPNDVPGDFVALGDSGTFAGVTLTLLYVLQIVVPGSPFWLRWVVTDENGCTTTVYAYFDQGLPEDDLSAVHAYLIVQGAVYEVTIPAAAVTTEPGPPMEPLVLEGIVPVCPAPQQGVAVIPACGPMPVEVIEGTAPEMASVALGGLAGSAGQIQTITIPAGARVVVLNHATNTPSAESDTLLAMDNGNGVTLYPGNGPLVLEAPSGRVFPELQVKFQVSAGASADRYVNWSAWG